MTAAARHPPAPVSIDAFIAWRDQPSLGGRYELYDGAIVQMSPERAAHGDVKGQIYYLFRQAIRHAKLACRVMTDGMAVPVGDNSVFEPDALVYCGTRLGRGEVLVRNPVIVVEVVSPSSARRDRHEKIIGYFNNGSVQHYLVVLIERQLVVHHRREPGGGIHTLIMANGDLSLDPPGLVLPVAEIFEDF